LRAHPPHCFTAMPRVRWSISHLHRERGRESVCERERASVREGESGRERERERARVRDGERKSGCARQSEQEGGQMEGVEHTRERDREKQREKKYPL